MQWHYWQRLREGFAGMDLREKWTFRLHLIYSLLDGFALGVIALNEFVFLRDMGASTLHVSFLFQISVFVMPFSIFLTHFLSQVRNKKRMLLLIAFITRAPLLLFLFFPRNVYLLPHKEFYIYFYLVIFLLYYIANPVILPVINLFTKANYRGARFGKLFSYSLTITQIVLLVTTLAFGRMLDWDSNTYRFVFPVMGVLGFVAIYLITLIPYKQPRELQQQQPAELSIKNIFNQALNILKTNKAFADFQGGMMAYGIGFLMALAVITVYLSKHFMLNYTEIAFYKNVPIIISIIVFPFFGSQIDKRDPRQFAILSFFFALLFYAFLIAAAVWPAETAIKGYRIIWLIAVAYIFNGLFNGSMGLIWGIGSSYFAPPALAARYHAVHLSLTGIRGLTSPLLGVWIFQLSGYFGAFGCSIAFEALAMYLMKRSLKKRESVHSEN